MGGCGSKHAAESRVVSAPSRSSSAKPVPAPAPAPATTTEEVQEEAPEGQNPPRTESPESRWSWSVILAPTPSAGDDTGAAATVVGAAASSPPAATSAGAAEGGGSPGVRRKPSPSEDDGVTRVAHVAAVTWRVEARASDVAAFLTLPSSWVKLMGLTGESRVEMGAGGDFKVARPDDEVVNMTEMKSADGDGGAKVVSYRLLLTHKKDGEAGLLKPVFAARHTFTMTPDGENGCSVRHEETDFEQHENLAVPMTSLGFLSENASLTLLCEAAKRHAAVSLVDKSAQISAVEMLRQIHAGTRTCVSFAEQLLARIEATNKAINACVDLAPRDALLARAAQVDAKVAAGEPLRPLEGLLLVIKANIDTAGMLTDASSTALQGHRPTRNAPIVQKLEEAREICIAKTNMPELASAMVGYNPHTGHCWNPHALGHNPGGSSNGTAAAIAAGMAPCGLGSDTAGSLRIPAEMCGVAGMRPSKCRYPQEGCVPLGRPDTMGPMGLCVADIALLDAVITGDDMLDVETDATALVGVKVCVPAAWVGDVAPGTRAALDLAIAALRAAGATVEEEDAASTNVDEKLNAATLMWPKGPNTGRRALETYLRSHESLAGVTADTIAEKFHFTNPLIPMVLTTEEARVTAAMSEEELAEALAPHLAEKAALEGVLDEYFATSGVAFLLTPITAAAPAKHSFGEKSFERLEAACAVANATGDFKARVGACIPLYLAPSHTNNKLLDLDVPSIALPTAARHQVEGVSLPAGVCIWGAPRSDRRLLALGVALEAQLAKM